MKKIFLFAAAALLVSGNAIAENDYPQAWVTECGVDEPEGYEENETSFYTFHCFNPNNGDEQIFARYAAKEALSVADQARIKQVFKQINAGLDTTALDLATFDPANIGGYADWTADYEVSFDQAVTAEEFKLAGSYAANQEGAWVEVNGQALAADEVIGLMSAFDPNLKYWELVAAIPQFHCGIIGLDKAANEGKTFTVRLYLYNPQDKSDKKLVNETAYTFSQTTGLQDVVSAAHATKQMVNGQMVIIRNGKMFNALGAEM